MASFDEVKAACLAMKPGEKRTFTLNETPDARGELAAFIVDVTNLMRGQGHAYVFHGPQPNQITVTRY